MIYTLVVYLMVLVALGGTSKRILTILIALDVFLFALLTFGNAKRNETISAACHELDRDGKLLGKVFRPLIDLMFSPFEYQHCWEAWLIENPQPNGKY